MKIAINGDIIDTKNIYKIHRISKNHVKGGTKIWFHYFEIESFKNKFIRIDLDFNESDLHNEIKQNQFIKKISDFRESIIKIWLENQSDIPQFNLE